MEISNKLFVKIDECCNSYDCPKFKQCAKAYINRGDYDIRAGFDYANYCIQLIYPKSTDGNQKIDTVYMCGEKGKYKKFEEVLK